MAEGSKLILSAGKSTCITGSVSCHLVVSSRPRDKCLKKFPNAIPKISRMRIEYSLQFYRIGTETGEILASTGQYDAVF